MELTGQPFDRDPDDQRLTSYISLPFVIANGKATRGTIQRLLLEMDADRMAIDASGPLIELLIKTPFSRPYISRS